MTMTLDRRGFEEWATSRGMWLLPSCNGVGTYCGAETELAWESWLAAKAHLSQPQPVAQGESVALNIEWPEFHQQGMGCGLEDRGITDRYEAMRYGWDEALHACAQAVDNATPTIPTVCACGAECRDTGHGNCRYAPTTIPTGHRVVPVEQFDFVAHLQRQREWSGKTFGPGSRAQGVVDHIRKELMEIEADPGDLKEWIDVVILSLDGAWRSGATPEEIIAALVAKQTRNEGRVWPDWRTADPTKAIEHDRSHDASPSSGGV